MQHHPLYTLYSLGTDAIVTNTRQSLYSQLPYGHHISCFYLEENDCMCIDTQMQRITSLILYIPIIHIESRTRTKSLKASWLWLLDVISHAPLH